MVTMETKTDVKPKQPMMENGPYLEKFEQFEKGAKDPAWVRVARKAGISHFVELGFPTLRDEDWRFTNVAPIAKLPFEPVVAKTPAPYKSIIDAADRQKCDAIFMASNGHRGLTGLLLGSVTQQVLTHSKIPVLVFR